MIRTAIIGLGAVTRNIHLPAYSRLKNEERRLGTSSVRRAFMQWTRRSPCKMIRYRQPGASVTARPPGRLSFATVPFERRWYAKLLHPIAIATNLFVTAWLYPSWRTARVRWSPPFGGLMNRAGAERRPIIFYSWHEYEPLMFLAFRDVPDPLKVTVIGHDGLVSRMLQQTAARLGFHVWIYRRRSTISPKEQIIKLIQTRQCNIGLIPDAGGPYRKVKPGIAEIARATNALVVPLVPLGQPALTVPWPKRFILPLPFCSLVVCTGTALDGSTTTVAECQNALEGIEEIARRERRSGAAR